MGSNPINLVFRFGLEIAALTAFGFWGWNQADGWLKYILALGIPLLASVLWGIFAVPDDPSRSGKAPFPVPGIIRLVLESVFFIFACLAFIQKGMPVIGYLLGFLVILHYGLSFDRIQWLLNQK